ncbi:peptidase inhibitor 16-like [Haliotis asinina]|uniref:peptidase inhibitor 16-like n=1 Tax=Haliotis asinina TaxID=109174 RepID=UPI00353181F1
MGVCEQLYNMLPLVAVLLPLCTAEIVDITAYHGKIVDRHNEIRREVGASDMRQMAWSDDLSKSAENWVMSCQYERAPSYISDCGQNLFYTNRFVESWGGIDRTIRKAIAAWDGDRAFFRYGKDCGSACAYSQIVWSTTTSVGCAMNRCYRMQTGAFEKYYTTLFACFYSPKGEMTNDFPFTPGVACTQCPLGAMCEAGLCRTQALQAQIVHGPEVAPGVGAVDNVPVRVPVTEPPVVPSVCFANMTTQEVHFILLVTNNLRARDSAYPVTWSDELEQWANYVIRCDIEYPGPRTAYTNFGKTGATSLLYQLVYDWGDEGSTVTTLLTRGCRTPGDAATCNHNTNLMAATNTRMGCAACMCGLQRQLTCIYDSKTV